MVVKEHFSYVLACNYNYNLHPHSLPLLHPLIPLHPFIPLHPNTLCIHYIHYTSYTPCTLCTSYTPFTARETVSIKLKLKSSVCLSN